MNVYFCRAASMPEGGLFVTAPTRDSARRIFCGEVGCTYKDSRVRIVRHGVCCGTQKVLHIGDPDLERFRVAYREE